MQCSRCGAYVYEGSLYCGNCSARINEAPVAQAMPAQEQTLFEPVPPSAVEPATPFAAFTPEMPVAPSVASTPSMPAFAPAQPAQVVFAQPASQAALPPGAPPFSSSPGMPGTPEPGGWAEFSGVQPPLAPGMPAGSGLYPVQALPPGYPAPMPYGDAPAPNFAPSGVYPPLLMRPLPTPAPRPMRRWPTFLLGMIVGILLTLIFGGLIIGLRSSPTPNGATLLTPVSTTAATGTATPVDGNLLYQQVTSQTPFLTDSLQNATQSQWSVFEKPLYGCEVKNDGLHVHIKDPAHFTYCPYDRSSLSNFALQVEMRLLTGDGGGIVFRNDTLGNLYYFHVLPDGRYNIYIEQGHKFTSKLYTGQINVFSSNEKTTLTLIAKGSQIYLYADQQFLTYLQDTTYTSGFLGLMANNSNSPAEAVYTNAKIWKL